MEYREKLKLSCKIVSFFTCVALLSVCLFNDLLETRQSIASIEILPEPNQVLKRSDNYSYAVLKGITIDPQNPLRIKFLVDSEDQGNVTTKEIEKLVSYFVASLTIPLEDFWVNLSPYEQNRIIPDELGITSMGRDMLAQDYILKQLASSLTHPDTEVGKEYWSHVTKYGLESDGFNKIWIVPEKADVYEKDLTVFVVDSKLKVLTEADYLASEVAQASVAETSSSIITDKLIPILEDEVNRGKNFAELRQIYNALILSVWFKNKFSNTFYNNYIDKKKMTGHDTANPDSKHNIFDLYVQSFQSGAYDIVRTNNVTRKQRRYFSGGALLSALPSVFKVVKHGMSSALNGKGFECTVALRSVNDQSGSPLSEAFNKIKLSVSVLVFSVFFAIPVLAGDLTAELENVYEDTVDDIGNYLSRKYNRTHSKNYIDKDEAIDSLYYDLQKAVEIGDEDAIRKIASSLRYYLNKSKKFKRFSYDLINFYYGGDYIERLKMKLLPHELKNRMAWMTACVLRELFVSILMQKQNINYLNILTLRHLSGGFFSNDRKKIYILDTTYGKYAPAIIDLETDYHRVGDTYFLKRNGKITEEKMLELRKKVTIPNTIYIKKNIVKKMSDYQRMAVLYPYLTLNSSDTVLLNLTSGSDEMYDNAKSHELSERYHASNPENLDANSNLLESYVLKAVRSLENTDTSESEKLILETDKLAKKVEVGIKNIEDKAAFILTAEVYLERTREILRAYKEFRAIVDIQKFLDKDVVTNDPTVYLDSIHSVISDTSDKYFGGTKFESKDRTALFDLFSTNYTNPYYVFGDAFGTLDDELKVEMNHLFDWVALHIVRGDYLRARMEFIKSIYMPFVDHTDDAVMNEGFYKFFINNALPLRENVDIYPVSAAVVNLYAHRGYKEILHFPQLDAKSKAPLVKKLVSWYQTSIYFNISFEQYDQAFLYLRNLLSIDPESLELYEVSANFYYELAISSHTDGSIKNEYFNIAGAFCKKYLKHIKKHKKSKKKGYKNVTRYIKHYLKQIKKKTKRFKAKKYKPDLFYFEKVQKSRQTKKESEEKVGGIDFNQVIEAPIQSLSSDALVSDAFDADGFKGFFFDIEALREVTEINEF